MDRSNSPQGRKSQGRIKINFEASEKLSILFSQQSDTNLVFSSAEHVANEKGKATEHHDDHKSITEANYNNTCVRVNSLPKIVIKPAANEKNGAAITSTNSNIKTNSPPTIKLPLLPTSPQQRIRSASLRRTPSAAIRTRPSPIGAEKQPNNVRFQSFTNSPSSVQNGEKETAKQPEPKPIALDERKPASTESSTSNESLMASQETPTPLAEDANGKDVPLPSPSTTNNVSVNL